MSHRMILGSALLCLLPACTSSVFNEPVTVSTTVDAVEVVRELGTVTVESCETMVLLVPVTVTNYADMYDELLRAARRRGGDGVVDLQGRWTSGSMVIPFYNYGCYELVGTAVVTREGSPLRAPAERHRGVEQKTAVPVLQHAAEPELAQTGEGDVGAVGRSSR